MNSNNISIWCPVCDDSVDISELSTLIPCGHLICAYHELKDNKCLVCDIEVLSQQRLNLNVKKLKTEDSTPYPSFPPVSPSRTVNINRPESLAIKTTTTTTTTSPRSLLEEKLLKPVNILQKKYCKTHHYKLRCFCLVCEIAVCTECFVDDHEGHKIAPMKPEIIEHIKDISYQMRNDRNHNKGRVSQQIELELASSELGSQKKKYFEEFIKKACKTIKKSFLDQSNSIFNPFLQTLEDSLKQKKEHLERLSNIQDLSLFDGYDNDQLVRQAIFDFLETINITRQWNQESISHNQFTNYASERRELCDRISYLFLNGIEKINEITKKSEKVSQYDESTLEDSLYKELDKRFELVSVSVCKEDPSWIIMNRYHIGSGRIVVNSNRRFQVRNSKGALDIKGAISVAMNNNSLHIFCEGEMKRCDYDIDSKKIHVKSLKFQSPDEEEQDIKSDSIMISFDKELQHFFYSVIGFRPEITDDFDNSSQNDGNSQREERPDVNQPSPANDITTNSPTTIPTSTTSPLDNQNTLIPSPSSILSPSDPSSSFSTIVSPSPITTTSSPTLNSTSINTPPTTNQDIMSIDSTTTNNNQTSHDTNMINNNTGGILSILTTDSYEIKSEPTEQMPISITASPITASPTISTSPPTTEVIVPIADISKEETPMDTEKTIDTTTPQFVSPDKPFDTTTPPQLATPDKPINYVIEQMIPSQPVGYSNKRLNPDSLFRLAKVNGLPFICKTEANDVYQSYIQIDEESPLYNISFIKPNNMKFLVCVASFYDETTGYLYLLWNHRFERIKLDTNQIEILEESPVIHSSLDEFNNLVDINPSSFRKLSIPYLYLDRQLYFLNIDSKNRPVIVSFHLDLLLWINSAFPLESSGEAYCFYEKPSTQQSTTTTQQPAQSYVDVDDNETQNSKKRTRKHK